LHVIANLAMYSEELQQKLLAFRETQTLKAKQMTLP
jgi:hypothetical protein